MHFSTPPTPIGEAAPLSTWAAATAVDSDRAPPFLPPALSGEGFDLDDALVGRVHAYRSGPDRAAEDPPILLVHSVNAAGSAMEVRPLYEHYGTSRPTYAIDLPGFGLSDRSRRSYTPRLMTDAVHALVREIQRREGPAPIDVLGLSLSSEFVARAACEDPDSFRTLALVSPTGFNGRKRHYGPAGSTREVPGMYALITCPLWASGLYRLLTRPGVIRYFLERTWGGKNIDEPMWAYDVLTTRQVGAENAPFCFLSARLFSNDINRIYDELTLPTWMSHGVRGDFVDYQGSKGLRSRTHWKVDVFPTGAMPYFEVPDAFIAAYDDFLGRKLLR